MAGFLADENIPASAIDACRETGIDVSAVGEHVPGASDEAVISVAHAEQRVVLTFDKDFGRLIFGKGAAGSAGVVLLRLPLGDPHLLARRIVTALRSRDDWRGNFSVIEPDRIRMTRLPTGEG